MAATKTKKDGNPLYLQFKHLRLSKKAREYQHEIGHITSDLLYINQRVQRCMVQCQFVINTLGKPKAGYRIAGGKQFESFDELLYHMENFIYRIFAYRDKMALFLNYTLDAPFEEGEMNLIKRFVKLKDSRRFHIDTEVARFYGNPIKDLLEKRKLMSHRAYYKEYNPRFMPEMDPHEHGLRKTTVAWRKKVTEEAAKIDDCLVEIFTINTNLTKKLEKYLDSKSASPVRIGKSVNASEPGPLEISVAN